MKKNFTSKRIFIAITFLAIVIVAFTWERNVPENKHASEVSKPCNVDIGCPSSDSKKYSHASLGFSFLYPKSYLLSSFGSVYDESGETILLQTEESKSGLQILVTAFDEDVVLTEERIRRDVPDMMMTDVNSRTIGLKDKKINAIVFVNTNSFMGKSHEAWFVHEKRLYQVSAPLDAKELFNSIITSWEF